MSRSIHTTKKALLHERKFAANDDAAPCASITALEQSDIKKRIHKLNAHWLKQSQKAKTPIHAHLATTADDETIKKLKRLNRKHAPSID